MSNKYLLEIGVEELPARHIPQALEQLESNTRKVLESSRVGYENILLYNTPRRLTLIIEGISDRQETIKDSQKGPSKKIAFNENNEPTKALEGFMKGKGITIDDITLEEVNGEEYVYANIVKEGKDTKELLKEEMPNIIKNISFPKTMTWGGKNIRFARPIRWLVSIFNDEIVEFDLEGIKIGNITQGHRFLGEKNIVIDNVDNYYDILKKNYCLVDQAERKKIIKYESEKLAKSKGGLLLLDEDLLDEITNIVEYPTPMIGKIDKSYLELPDDVIITPMKEQLRFIPVVDNDNILLPYFVTVRNGNDEFLDSVIKGNEKVLGARLEDAKFFYEEDILIPLEEYVDELKNVIYQDKLGTVYDKVERLRNLGNRVGDYLEVGDTTKDNLDRAAYLSKADLVTKMVDEFAELQGKMGMEYALHSGENEIVSLAIYEQYLPKFAGDKLPTTTAGAILSIVDKMDSIAGLFAIGLKPTSSQDPYGLRRQAIGLINILLDKKLNLNLNSLIDSALYNYVEKNSLIFNDREIKNEIIEFFNGRLRNMLIDMGIRYDIVDGLLNTNIDDLYDLFIRAEELNAYLNEDGLEDVLSTFNRVINISKDGEVKEIDIKLLNEKEEIELYNAYNNMIEDYNQLLNDKEYRKALEIFIDLKQPVDDFFDNIMVMVDDEDIKNNRLSLLKTISDNMLKICDLSKIVR